MIHTTPPDHAYALSFTAQTSDIDDLGHVNNAVWVQWIQVAATRHWAACTTMEQQSNYIWVVVRHEIDYLRPLTVGHVVTAQTWVDATARGAQSNRYVRFTGADGKLCVAAATSWALINRVSGRLQRVPAELLARFQNKIC